MIHRQLQVSVGPAGDLLWASGALPGSVHRRCGLRAANAIDCCCHQPR
jgi:hypothetical protein